MSNEELRELNPPYRVVRDFDFAESLYFPDESKEAVYGFSMGFLVSVQPGGDQEATLMFLSRAKATELRDRLNALLAHPDTQH